jgi:hypothetical protein
MILTAWPICLPLRPRSKAMRACLVGLEAHEGVDGLLEDGVGVGLGDLLDLDAALGGGDEDVAAGVAVGGDGEVVLVVDVDARRRRGAW